VNPFEQLIGMTKQTFRLCTSVKVCIPVVREDACLGEGTWKHFWIAQPMNLARLSITVYLPSDPCLWRVGVQAMNGNNAVDSQSTKLPKGSCDDDNTDVTFVVWFSFSGLGYT
jgi:hypothetical protein